MTAYLVFDLYGPFASFGDVAVGEYRPTYFYPSKSAILGMLAASLGIKRKEEGLLQALSEDLKVAVLVLSSGQLLRDFHTIQVPPKTQLKHRTVSTRKDELSFEKQNTIISTRDYRMDSYYRIAVWSETGAHDLTELQQALSFPKFTPYLGRKSCPSALPFKADIIHAENASNALTKYRLNSDLLKSLLKVDRETKFMIFSDPTRKNPEGNEAVVHKTVRRDRLVSRKNWQYGERYEIMQYVGGKDVFQQNTETN